MVRHAFEVSSSPSLSSFSLSLSALALIYSFLSSFLFSFFADLSPFSPLCCTFISLDSDFDARNTSLVKQSGSPFLLTCSNPSHRPTVLLSHQALDTPLTYTTYVFIPQASHSRRFNTAPDLQTLRLHPFRFSSLLPLHKLDTRDASARLGCAISGSSWPRPFFHSFA